MTEFRRGFSLLVLGSLLVLNPVPLSPLRDMQAGQLPVVPARPAPAVNADRPRLEPVAEVKLIMEGFTKPNFDGLTKLLANKPMDQESWVFARGQALLVAESANLLMIRPPRTKPSQGVWLTRASELRSTARELGRAIAAKDYPATQTGLAALANQCNRCHADFQVQVRVDPRPDDQK